MKASEFIEACKGKTPIILKPIGTKVKYVHTASKWFLMFDMNSPVLGRLGGYEVVSITTDGGAIMAEIAKIK